MKKTIFVVIVSALLLSLAVPAIAAPPPDNPGKGPPDLEKIVFIHYGKDFAPGKPPDTPGNGPGNKDKEPDLYSYSRIHWADGDIPVRYYINPAYDPTYGDAEAGIRAAFDTWEADEGSYIDFYCPEDNTGYTERAPGVEAYSPDGYNVVGWLDLTAIDPVEFENAIGVTTVWFTRGRKLLVDCDTALNNHSTLDEYTDYKWIQYAGGSWVNDPLYYDVDVQNIMVHEAGHWLMLDDLYFEEASEQTMYGYAGELELYKRDLADGDIEGVRKIYPGATK